MSRPRLRPVLPPMAPRLRRAQAGRVFAGVCAGIADAYDLDRGYVRTLAVLTCFIGGAGFIAYVAAVALMPADEEPTSAPADLDPVAAWLGLALLTLGAFLVAAFDLQRYRLFALSPAAFWPALLLGLTILLVERQRRHGDVMPRLTRPRRGRLLLGVAAGLARHASASVDLIRMALCVVTIWSFGLALLLYLVVGAFLVEDAESSA